MRRCGVLILASVFIFAGGSVAAQRNPDFSGTWLLVSAPGMGGETTGGRGGRGGGVVSEVSGAAFNCGLECTIVQNAGALTISRPVNPKGVKPSDVVIRLDGRDSHEYKAIVKWDAEKLVVTRTIAGSLAVTQTLTRAENKMTVVSSFSVPGDVPVTLTYARKM